MLKDNWSVFKSIDKLSEQLANDILLAAKNSIKLHNNFKIVLTGGNSIVNTYKILSNSESDWDKWYVYLGDERYFPAGNKNRNDHLINEVWLKNGLIPKGNINFIHTELGVDESALYYESVLDNVDSFDVTLLSVGEDGHVASLFPDRLYDENRSVVVERNSPKYPKERVSMSYSRLNQSRNIFKVVSGSSKQKAVDSWLKGEELPVTKICGNSEKVFICENLLKF